MKRFVVVLGVALWLSAVTGCKCGSVTTAEANLKTYRALKEDFEKGHLAVVQFSTKKRNDEATKDWVRVIEAAIKNNETAIEREKE